MGIINTRHSIQSGLISTDVITALPQVKSISTPPQIGSLTISGATAITTLTNQGSAWLLSQTGAGDINTHGWAAYTSIPASGAYSFTVGIQSLFCMGAASAGCGICISDGTKYEFFGIRTTPAPACSVMYMSTLDNIVTADFNATAAWPTTGPFFFLRIRDDRVSNLYFDTSADLENWIPMYVMNPRTGRLAPAYIGIMALQQTANIPTTLIRSMMKVFHWKISTG